MKPCKFYIKGNCKDGVNCKFDHIDNICRKFFFDGKCNLDSCKFSHEYKLENNNKNEQSLKDLDVTINNDETIGNLEKSIIEKIKNN